MTQRKWRFLLAMRGWGIFGKVKNCFTRLLDIQWGPNLGVKNAEERFTPQNSKVCIPLTPVTWVQSSCLTLAAAAWMSWHSPNLKFMNRWNQIAHTIQLCYQRHKQFPLNSWQGLQIWKRDEFHRDNLGFRNSYTNIVLI